MNVTNINYFGMLKRSSIQCAVRYFAFLSAAPALLSQASDGTRQLLPAGEFYTSTREAALGGAAVAVADDGDAIFYNPAGIGREDGDKPDILRGAAFPNFTLGMNKSTFELYRAYVKGNEKSKAQAIEQTLAAANGKQVITGQVSLFPYFTIGRFQIGFLSHSQGDGYVSKLNVAKESQFSTPDQPLSYDAQVKMQASSVAAIVTGMSIPLSPNASAGVSGRFGQRATLYRGLEVSDSVVRKSSESYGKFLNKTKGIGVDLGVLTTDPKLAGTPSFGVAVHDLGNTVYKGSSATQHDEMEKMNVVAGASFRPLNNSTSYTLVSVQGAHLNDGRVALRDKFGVGAEVGIGGRDSRAPFSIRAGHNMRAPSVGVGADLLFLRADATYYGKALDGADGVRVDPRFLIRMSVDLRG